MRKMSMTKLLNFARGNVEKPALTALATAAIVGLALPILTPGQSAAAEPAHVAHSARAVYVEAPATDDSLLPSAAELAGRFGTAVSGLFHRDGGTDDVVLADNGRRTISPAGLQLIKDFEGLSLTGYLLGDGMCTIGYGHAVPAATRPDCRQWTITEAEAEAMLLEDVQIYADAVSDWFTRDFNQNQFDALTSWMYNVGTGVFEKYGWDTAPDDERIAYNLGLYIFPAKFSEGLKARRAAEIALFQS